MDEQYICPVCAEEGNAEPQPLDAFYVYAAKPYARQDGRIIVKYKDNQRRTILCRRHHNLASTEDQRERLNPASPRYDADYHAKVKGYKRAYAKRKLDPKSPDYDPALHERQRESKRKKGKPKAAGQEE